MLAKPAAVSNCAKLRSACPVSKGVPSSKSLLSATPSRKPVSPVLGSPSCNSFHVIWNWPSVRLCFTPYSRVYFTRIFRLWINARADALRIASFWAIVEMTSPSRLWSFGFKPMTESDLLHDYGGNWPPGCSHPSQRRPARAGTPDALHWRRVAIQDPDADSRAFFWGAERPGRTFQRNPGTPRRRPASDSALPLRPPSGPFRGHAPFPGPFCKPGVFESRPNPARRRRGRPPPASERWSRGPRRRQARHPNRPRTHLHPGRVGPVEAAPGWRCRYLRRHRAE